MDKWTTLDTKWPTVAYFIIKYSSEIKSQVEFKQLDETSVFKKAQGSTPAASKALDVPVLLPQDRHLVLEEHGVQPHLRVCERHEPQPAGERVHAGLSLGKVVRVCPAGHLGPLWRTEITPTL